MASIRQPFARVCANTTFRLSAIAVITTALVVACDRVPLTSPSGSTIAVTIDRDTLPIGGTATVKAIVSEVTGTPVHNGTMVTFQPSIGRTEPLEAPTVNGIATATFIAGSISGSGVIHAFSGPARTGSGNSSAGGVTIKIGTAGVERVTVRTEPLSVPISGGTVVVVAAIFDAGGNPIINTPVSISSDFGSLSANSAVSDANGEARVQLTTNRTTKVTVLAGSKSGDFTLQALSPPIVTLTCTGSPAATVGVPVSCTIGVTSQNTTSSAPIQNLTVNWGDGSGEQPLGVNASTIVSHTYTSAGSFVVTAAATDGNSQRGTAVLTLNVIRSIPTITITPSATTATVGATLTFTVVPPTSPAIPTTNVTVDFGDGTSRNLGAITGSTAVPKAYGGPGTYVVSATITDAAGGRNTASTAVVISAAAAPVVTLSQTGNIAAGKGTFSVGATASGGATITSVVVRRGIDNQGAIVYQSNSGGTAVFVVDNLVVNEVLTATATDSLGATGTAQLIVK